MLQVIRRFETEIRQAASIPDAFLRRMEASPEAIAYMEFRGGRWRDVSWRGIGALVARRRAALAQAGLKLGDRVGIFLPNCVDWVVTDLAAMAEGLVTVPVYTRDSAANICHVLRDSAATLCITDTAERWASLDTETNPLPDLQHVWIVEGDSLPEDPRATIIRDPGADCEAMSEPYCGDRDALATIIYTSGTTGPPKGVMLSHGALLWNASAVSRVTPVRPDDMFLSILPLAHAFERTVGWLCPMLGGATVAFARSVEELREDLQDLRPTILLAVPRLFEKIKSAAEERSESAAISRMLLRKTVEIGWIRRRATEGTGPAPSLPARLFWALVGDSVAARARGALGGRTRIILSGGAPLSDDTARFIAALEFPLIEGYGLTEAGPAVTGCTLEERRFGSVGRALPGAELAIGDRQELLVRSPGVMLGYWNNTAATREVLDADGWLHTGDAAEIIDDRVFIRGRIKDILVLSTGENVNPSPIETALLSDPLIDQACVLGDGKPWCSAVVVVAPGPYRRWIAQNHLDARDLNGIQARKALTARLEKHMQDVPPFARVRDVFLELDPWSLESGLITPTLKAKRPRIAKHYAREIDALYR